ncbi:GTPase IMAP family member 7-like isoform X1 [Sparus aurata]|uniref:GTPase IMAP family member 7-like isoform X1 n=1 Tax=Sparus aurata TaxID=8175 RepID=UPI0011C0D63F|nr:GTPase IMAP family member 7-like isoform X1 [Sparus aurata]
MADVSNTMRIVMLGKTGAGRSSLANTIFGEERFKISHTLNSETRQCKSETRSVNGRSITLVDTPGLFDTHRSEEELKPEIVRCITECAPGPHAFLIVLKVDIFTDQEQVGMKKIQKYFSDDVFKSATVVFTHGDQLPEGETIEDFVCKDKILSDLVKKCGGRCHVIDNTYWKNTPKNEYRSNQFQVEELLKTIDTIVKENNRSYYSTEMLLKERAKGRVFKKYFIRSVLIVIGEMFRYAVGVAFSFAFSLRFRTVAAGVVGAVVGGVTGCIKGKGADTAEEAGVVKNEIPSVLDEANSSTPMFKHR